MSGIITQNSSNQINPGSVVKLEVMDHSHSLPHQDLPSQLEVEIPHQEIITPDTHDDEDDDEENEDDEDDEEEEEDSPQTSMITTPTEKSEELHNNGNNNAQISPQQQKFQDVRVDNWGNYCLQRLQVMYDRGDFCDLTMQFHTNQLLKVHKVVVNLCTEYFANLERLFGLTEGVLVLPKDIEYQAMVTVVKFFYTGKLEIRANQFNEVYRTVKLMNITILVKLLEAHAKKPLTPKKEPTRPLMFKQSTEIGRQLQKGQGTVKIGGSTAFAIQGAGGTKTLQVTTPGAKLPPGVKTKTVLARVQPQGIRMVGQQGYAKVISQKKLPIWKERRFNPASEQIWPIKDEPARPTRFEWGDPDEDPVMSFSTGSGPVVSHTLMEKQKACGSTRKIEDIFDAVKSQTLGKRNITDQSKNSSEQPPNKTSKVVNNVPLASNEVMVEQVSENDHVNLTEDTVEEEVSTTELTILPETVKKSPVQLKPALKPQPTRYTHTHMVGKNDPNLGDLGKSNDTNAASGSKIHLQHMKTVRFAPEVEKENSKNSSTDTQFQEIVTEEDVTSSHSKIISEVLKKYPDLVKDKQNIRLKIVQKGAESSPSKDKSKVSYIVLKSTSSPEAMGSVLLKKSNQASHKPFWDRAEQVDRKPSGAENTTGPWLCGPCGGGDESPMEFESYYVYRRHLVDIHAARIDSRICEYCGQKASKINLLWFHLYTKHGVTPPKNMQFPNCDKCDYIALSDSLLLKHKLTHDASKEFSCQTCSATFKSSGALQGHMAANLHRNKDTKVYECPYCRKPFVRNINLKGHIRALHRDIARIEEMDDPRLPHDETLMNRPNSSQPILNRKRQYPAILGSRSVPLEILPGDGHAQGQQQVSLVTADGHTIEILQGIDPNSMSVPMTLVPSSEAEAMTNVASSIATSLGLEHGGIHGGTEFMTGTDGSQAVYIMDNSQPAVEVDMSAMGLTTTDGTMIYEGDDSNTQGQYIVQDSFGNQFRKMTGIDEHGKPVIFFQLSEEHVPITIASTVLEDGIQITGENNSVYVTSDITAPVTVTSDSNNTQQQTQVLLGEHNNDHNDAEEEDTVYDIVADAHQESHDEQVEISNDQEHHNYQESNEQHDDDQQQQLEIVIDHQSDVKEEPAVYEENSENDQGEEEEETVITSVECDTEDIVEEVVQDDNDEEDKDQQESSQTEIIQTQFVEDENGDIHEQLTQTVTIEEMVEEEVVDEED